MAKNSVCKQIKMMRKEAIFSRYGPRLKVDNALVRKIENLPLPALDWEYIVTRAQEQGVAALLYKCILNNNFSSIVPLKALEGLKNYYYLLLERNILILKAWEDGLAVLAKEKIEVLVFKGPALLEQVYKDPGLRPMGDIDILVRFQDLAAAGRVLEGLGYRAALEVGGISSGWINAQRNSIMYFRDAQNSAFFWHVYWHIINFLPYSPAIVKKIDMLRIWQEASYGKVNGLRWRGFSLHHHLIYLSLHAFSHRYEPLILICDLNELIQSQKENIDWDVVIEEAKVLGLEKYLYYSLYLLVSILDTDIPGGVLERLRPERVSVWERKFIRAILEGRPFFLGEIFASLAMNENVRERFAYLHTLLFPRRQEMAIIRQKDCARVGIGDYLSRIVFSFSYYRKDAS